MPEWAMQLLVTAGGLGLMAGGAKAWWAAWREDRKAKRDGAASEKRTLEARVEKLQDKLESLLMDAAAKGQDDRREKAEMIAMLAKMNELASAMAEALKDFTKARAKDAP
jgi:outer membrane murein-binding lipoprotein Lpp